MNNTLIITGGEIQKDFLNHHLKHNSYQNLIAVDNGLEILDELHILPTHIVGDFDTINEKILEKYRNNENVLIEEYQPEKDYTDTDIAIKLAIKLKSTNIVIIGGTGKRIDHLLSNIHILLQALENNIQAKIIDEKNEISLINKNIELYKHQLTGKYLSLIPLTTQVKGLTLTGMKYPLENATLKIGESLGISNELVDKIGSIQLQEGILILINSKD